MIFRWPPVFGPRSKARGAIPPPPCSSVYGIHNRTHTVCSHTQWTRLAHARSERTRTERAHLSHCLCHSFTHANTSSEPPHNTMSSSIDTSSSHHHHCCSSFIDASSSHRTMPSHHIALTIAHRHRITHRHRIDTSSFVHRHRIIVTSSHRIAYRITSSHLLLFVIIVYCVSHRVSHRIITH